MNLISQYSFMKAIIAVALVAPALSHAGNWYYDSPGSYGYATLKEAWKGVNQVNSTQCLSNKGERIFAGSPTRLPIGTKSLCASAPVFVPDKWEPHYTVSKWYWVVR